MHLGAGWHIHHLTDRVIELRKDDYFYRRFTGRDGFVRVRSEPGMSRNDLLQAAVKMANRNDEALQTLVAKRIVPNRVSYEMRQRQLAPAFTTGQEPEIIGVKRP